MQGENNGSKAEVHGKKITKVIYNAHWESKFPNGKTIRR